MLNCEGGGEVGGPGEIGAGIGGRVWGGIARKGTGFARRGLDCEEGTKERVPLPFWDGMGICLLRLDLRVRDGGLNEERGSSESSR